MPIYKNNENLKSKKNNLNFLNKYKFNSGILKKNVKINFDRNIIINKKKIII